MLHLAQIVIAVVTEDVSLSEITMKQAAASSSLQMFTSCAECGGGSKHARNIHIAATNLCSCTR